MQKLLNSRAMVLVYKMYERKHNRKGMGARLGTNLCYGVKYSAVCEVAVMPIFRQKAF